MSGESLGSKIAVRFGIMQKIFSEESQPMAAVKLGGTPLGTNSQCRRLGHSCGAVCQLRLAVTERLDDNTRLLHVMITVSTGNCSLGMLRIRFGFCPTMTKVVLASLEAHGVGSHGAAARPIAAVCRASSTCSSLFRGFQLTHLYSFARKLPPELRPRCFVIGGMKKAAFTSIRVLLPTLHLDIWVDHSGLDGAVPLHEQYLGKMLARIEARQEASIQVPISRQRAIIALSRMSVQGMQKGKPVHRRDEIEDGRKEMQY